MDAKLEQTKEFVTVLTGEVSGNALDWAVSTCEGYPIDLPGFYGEKNFDIIRGGSITSFHPSINWSEGGPIINREFIDIKWVGISNCRASIDSEGCHHESYGPNQLVSAMRCYVTSKMGLEIQIPMSLWNDSMPVVPVSPNVSTPKRNKP